MPKIHDNVDIKGKMTGNIESDNTHFKDATDDTKVLKLNQQGQDTAQMVTLYSFENGAFVVEPETSNLQNVNAGDLFVFIPNLPDTFQLVANHNPTGYALVNAPAGVTVDGNGLISWDGLGAVTSNSVTIEVTNQFGTSQTVVTITINSGFAGNPVLALSSLEFASETNGASIQTWSDTSGGGHDFQELTVADQPTVVKDAFATNVDGLRFDGVSQLMASTSLSDAIFNVNNGSQGEAYIVFRFEGVSLPAGNIPLFWSFRNASTQHILITYNGTTNQIRVTPQINTETKDVAFTASLNTTYVLRVAWNSANFIEVQFEGQSATNFTTTSAISAVSATEGVNIGGADTVGGPFTIPIYADITYGAVVAYSNLLSAQEIQQNFDYINTLWNQ